MSNLSAQTNKLLLFKDERPDFVFTDQIYDPDLDGEYIEGMNKLIPHPGSGAIDRQTSILYYVASVDPVTYKSELVPARILVTSEVDDEIKILTYGTDRFMLYVDERESPVFLQPDTRAIIFGSATCEYRLVRYNSRGEKEIISVYVDSNGDIRGERIPLTTIVPGSAVKQLTNCHTLLSHLEDGEVVEAEVFNSIGVHCATITLYVKHATILNDLASSNQFITSFDAYSNQMLGNDFYLYCKQDYHHLVITPYVTYADGATEDLVVNNVDTFVYGLDRDTIAEFPGQKHKIMIKKYLTNKQMSTISKQLGDTRYITCEKTITVIANESLDAIKVSLVPIYDAHTKSYYLKYIAYSDRWDKVVDVGNAVTEAIKFDGGLFNQTQQVMFDVDLSKVLGASATLPYRQTNWIHLKPYNVFQRYIISDVADMSVCYGVESSVVRRPIIFYDPKLEQYYIPTSRFANQEAFLEAFYKNAKPMFDPRVELEPPTPTHFTIRTLDDLNTVVTVPIEVGSYSKAWNITRKGNPSMLVGWNVMVEFLQLTSSGEYSILWGSPVDVFQVSEKSDEYNTEDNAIARI